MCNKYVTIDWDPGKQLSDIIVFVCVYFDWSRIVYFDWSVVSNFQKKLFLVLLSYSSYIFHLKLVYQTKKILGGGLIIFLILGEGLNPQAHYITKHFKCYDNEAKRMVYIFQKWGINHLQYQKSLQEGHIGMNLWSESKKYNMESGLKLLFWIRDAFKHFATTSNQ